MESEIDKFIKESPGKANALAAEWEEFITTSARENPEILSIDSKEEFYRWTTQHPEKHIDPSIWLGKEITDAYLRRRQEDSVPQAQGSDDKKEERQREGPREIPEERVSQPTAPTTTYQPSIQTPTREFFNRGIGRGPFRLGGRVAGRTGGMAGRLASRLAVQAGMAAGRGAIAFFATPPGWITAAVIAVIVLIIIIVFLIVMLAGGGGGGGPSPGRLYECSSGFDFATSTANCSSGPDVDCIDPAGNPLLVPNGNTCATNAATFYSAQEGIPITASCVDKCVDSALTKICSPDISNTCPDPNFTCQGLEGTPVSGAGSKTFCIKYTSPSIGCENGVIGQDVGITSLGKKVHGCVPIVDYATAVTVCSAGWHVGDVVLDTGLASLLETTLPLPLDISRFVYMNGDPGNMTGIDSVDGTIANCWGVPQAPDCSNNIDSIPPLISAARPGYGMSSGALDVATKTYLNGILVTTKHVSHTGTGWSAVCVQN